MSAKRSSVYEDIERALAAASIRHPQVEMPISVIDATSGLFQTENGVQFHFHPYGLSYLSYHTHGTASTYQQLHQAGNYAGLADVANTDWRSLGSKDKLFFALYQGGLVGVMANYKPVDNMDIMRRIADLDLDQHLTGFSLSPIAFRAFLSVVVEKDHLVSLSIKNGHSGHIAFSYNARFSADLYEFEIPLTDNVRHLSRASIAVANLEEIMETAKEMEMDAKLRSTGIHTVYFWLSDLEPLTPSQNKLLDAVVELEPKNALEFVVMAARFSSTRGMKGAVKSFNDHVFKRVFPK